LAIKNGISRDTFWKRVRKHGWSEEDAATKPLKDMKIHAQLIADKHRVYPKEVLDLLRINKISYFTFITRIKRGKWDIYKAATTPPIPPIVSGKDGAVKSAKHRERMKTIRMQGV
jgi:hypothetical protein